MSDRGQRFETAPVERTERDRVRAFPMIRVGAMAPPSAAPVRVGISLFHSVGDRDRAVDQIHATIAMLVNAVHTAMGSHSYSQQNALDVISLAARDPGAAIARLAQMKAELGGEEHSKFYPLWHDEISPLLDNWNQFYRQQSSSSEFFTSWDEYEHWADRVEAAWNRAKGMGIKLGPFPGRLPKTFWAAAGDEIMSTVKIVAYGAVAVGGAFVLVKFAELFKGK